MSARHCEFCGSVISSAKANQIFCSNNGRCRRLASFHRKHPNHHRLASDVKRMQAQAFENVSPADLKRQIVELQHQVTFLIDLIQMRLPTPPLRDIPIFRNGNRIAQFD